MKFLVVHRGARMLVDSTTIDYVYSSLKYTELHYQGKIHLVETALTTIEPNLPDFVRVHRNCLVRRSLITGLVKVDDYYEVTLTTGASLKVSRRSLHEVRRLLNEMADA